MKHFIRLSLIGLGFVYISSTISIVKAMSLVEQEVEAAMAKEFEEHVAAVSELAASESFKGLIMDPLEKAALVQEAIQERELEANLKAAAAELSKVTLEQKMEILRKVNRITYTIAPSVEASVAEQMQIRRISIKVYRIEVTRFVRELEQKSAAAALD